MRRTVRPFTKEFKTRSAKSSAAHPQLFSDADNEGSKPSFLDLNVFSSRQNNNDDELKVALTAAEAVFGRSRPVAPLPETSPQKVMENPAVAQRREGQEFFAHSAQTANSPTKK